METILNELSFNAGAGEGAPPLVLRPSGVTILVGPNNSGKSAVLREIAQVIRRRDYSNCYLLNRVGIGVTPEQAHELAKQHLGDDPYTNPRLICTLPTSGFSGGNITESLLSMFNGGNCENTIAMYLAHYSIVLDGAARLALVGDQNADSLESNPQNHLWAIFVDSQKRKRLRELTAEAFDLHCVVDPTGMKVFRIKMSPRLPTSNAEEEGLGAPAQAFFKQATPIAKCGDGIKAYTGIISALIAAEYKLILIDEPEAFLHPPLERLLGRRLTELARANGANIVIATHSADFLIGCIQANCSIDVVRLTYSKGAATARSLPAADLAKMMREPLLRSSRVLDALFHNGAVVAEADGDRVFYEEMNERMNENGDGLQACVFLNATQKQSVYQIVGPLRRLGVAAAAIVDLDFLKEAKVFRALLRVCDMPPSILDSATQQRAAVLKMFEHLKLDPKVVGMDALKGKDRECLRVLDNLLKDYGVFMVPVGELECWLPEAANGSHGPAWLVKFLEISPGDTKYARPEHTGVWDFLRGISKWATDPKRLGIPVSLEGSAQERNEQDLPLQMG